MYFKEPSLIITIYGMGHLDLYLQSYDCITTVHSRVLDSFIDTQSYLPYASSCSTCHKQSILCPVLCADNRGAVYSSQFLVLAVPEPGTSTIRLYNWHASLLLYTLA